MASDWFAGSILLALGCCSRTEVEQAGACPSLRVEYEHTKACGAVGLNTISAQIGDVEFSLETAPGLFSPRRVDAGTLAMLSCVELVDGDKLLDLGCGCGVVGIYAAKVLGSERVFLIDSDPTAVEVSKSNAIRNGLPELSVSLSDGFRDFHEAGFTKILSNPPYHSDFSVAKHFILKGFNRLEIGGEMYFVTKRDKWYRNKLQSVFGNAKSRTVDGYFVITATKMQASYARRRQR